MYLNKFEFIGNLTDDSELRDAGSTKVLSFSMAMNWKTKNNEGVVFANNISYFGASAEGIAPHMKKGKQVLVEGRVENDSYEKDGVNVNTYKFTATKVVLGSSPATDAEMTTEGE